jgi:hypothetical protein
MKVLIHDRRSRGPRYEPGASTSTATSDFHAVAVVFGIYELEIANLPNGSLSYITFHYVLFTVVPSVEVAHCPP